MAEHIQSGTDALVVDQKDDVATLLRDVLAGEMISYRYGNKLEHVQAINDIPFGHKTAIKSVNKGNSIYKYGDVIGRATQDINVGEHVHIHNTEGIRGRGDQA